MNFIGLQNVLVRDNINGFSSFNSLIILIIWKKFKTSSLKVDKIYYV